MPKQVLPNPNAFAEFVSALDKLGFRKILAEETKKDFLRLEPKVPTPRTGREIGFTFEANGYKVVLWTTYLEEETQARKTDSGKIMIKEGDRVLYTAHPTHRTKNYLSNLLRRIKIARARVIHRPLCPKCGALMHIKRGTGLKSRFYQCDMSAHPRAVNRSWDYNLPPEVLKEVLRDRQPRIRYRKKLALEGKKPGAAMMKRKRWTTGKPQNKI